MLVPSFPVEKVIDDKGYLTPAWRTFFEQLLQNMNQSLSNEGIVIPPQTASNIALLTQSMNGTIIYNSDANSFQGKLGGVFKTFTLT
jgi:hypothetical protein